MSCSCRSGDRGQKQPWLRERNADAYTQLPYRRHRASRGPGSGRGSDLPSGPRFTRIGATENSSSRCGRILRWTNLSCPPSNPPASSPISSPPSGRTMRDPYGNPLRRLTGESHRPSLGHETPLPGVALGAFSRRRDEIWQEIPLPNRLPDNPSRGRQPRDSLRLMGSWCEGGALRRRLHTTSPEIAVPALVPGHINPDTNRSRP